MTPIVLFLFVPPLLMLALVPYTWRHRTMLGAKSFFMLVMALMVWGFCYALQLATVPDFAIKSFWSAAKYIGIAATPVVWFAFALEYTGHGEWLTRRRFIALFIVPAITAVMAFANPMNLMWPQQQLIATDLFVTVDSTPTQWGSWFLVHAIYSYVFILLGVALLVRTLRRFPQMYRQQAGALVLAVLLPLASNAIFISGLSPIPYLDLTSVAFTASALLFAWALFRYRLLDVVPVAREAVIASMTDIVVVIDLQNRIVDINPAGQQALGYAAKDIIGQPLETVFANWSDIVDRYIDMHEVHEEIALSTPAGTSQSYFDLRVTPIADQRGNVTGRLVVLRDITQGRLAESLSDSEKRMRRRATQLQTVAEVARIITSERNLAELLPLVTRLIGEHFDYYHVAIFLRDEAGEAVTLQAANSEGGQQLLAQGHQLKVGKEGVVGYVADTGAARTIADVSQSTEFLPNLDLPLTRSETALPLRVREQIIGVLDVQSTQVAAFTEEDVTLLATLADQVATAIENARSFQRLSVLAEENQRLLESSQQVVEELNALTRRLTTQAWEKYLTGEHSELVVEDVKPEPTTTSSESARFDPAREHTRSSTAANPHAMVTLPIMLRGEQIGTIDLEPPESNQSWEEENISIIKSVAERVGLALDNARLFEQTQTALSETDQLYNVGLHINTATTLEDLLQAAIAPSIATGASSAGIWLFERDKTGQPAEMTFEAAWARDGKSPMPLGTRFHITDFPSSKLWLNAAGQPSFVGDIARDERVDPALRTTFRQIDIAATGFMPLMIGARWVGLIIISWQEPHDFTASEQRMYQSVASQVAVAIENRRLLEQTQRDAEREHMLNRIATRLRNSQSVEQVLQIATQEVRAATRASVSIAEIAPAARPVGDHPQPGNGHAVRSEA